MKNDWMEWIRDSYVFLAALLILWGAYRLGCVHGRDETMTDFLDAVHERRAERFEEKVRKEGDQHPMGMAEPIVNPTDF